MDPPSPLHQPVHSTGNKRNFHSSFNSLEFSNHLEIFVLKDRPQTVNTITEWTNRVSVERSFHFLLFSKGYNANIECGLDDNAFLHQKLKFLKSTCPQFTIYKGPLYFAEP